MRAARGTLNVLNYGFEPTGSRRPYPPHFGVKRTTRFKYQHNESKARGTKTARITQTKGPRGSSRVPINPPDPARPTLDYRVGTLRPRGFQTTRFLHTALASRSVFFGPGDERFGSPPPALGSRLAPAAAHRRCWVRPPRRRRLREPRETAKFTFWPESRPSRAAPPSFRAFLVHWEESHPGIYRYRPQPQRHGRYDSVLSERMRLLVTSLVVGAVLCPLGFGGLGDPARSRRSSRNVRGGRKPPGRAIRTLQSPQFRRYQLHGDIKAISPMSHSFARSA
uniref:Uncharacterized protein n=1 Tax=Anatid alphaherpesvirus 2 TaxID=3080522 RepID=A0AAU0K6X5_9ALPH